jgi:hypothetical protein
MAPEPTSMADGCITRLVTNDGRGLGKVLKSSFAGVAEATMPGRRRGSCHKGTGAGGRGREL